MEEVYYGVTRSDEYLAHYGIKGMKWGVRKARESGSDRRLARQFRKAEKKLAKLEKRANSGGKYARRAVALGAGSAAAATLASKGVSKFTTDAMELGNKAVKGTAKVTQAASRALMKSKNPKLVSVGAGLSRINSAANRASVDLAYGKMATGSKLSKWARSNTLSSEAAKHLNSAGDTILRNSTKLSSNAAQNAAAGLGNAAYKAGAGIRKANLSNNTITRIGAAGLAAGLGAGAAYNAYRAATTKRAAAKANQFRNEMRGAFKGTKYAKQIGGSNRSSSNKKRRHA